MFEAKAEDRGKATHRPAQLTDTRVWLELRQALWPAEGNDHEVDIASYFDNGLSEPLEVMLAFGQTGNAIGLAELSIHPYAEGCATKRVAYLEGWYVVPAVRRQGVPLPYSLPRPTPRRQISGPTLSSRS